jgi:glycosyltransferase involved in cell wall biosynthesis
MFGMKKFGGFGRATRIIGRELVKRGVEVFAVVPRPRGVPSGEQEMDGIRLLSYPANSLSSAMELIRQCDADIYHSQDTSLATYLAMRAMPDRCHVITFRDPLSLKDRFVEARYGMSGNVSLKAKIGALLYSFYIDNFMVWKSVYRADALLAAAQCLIPKVKRKYPFLPREPIFMPTPVEIPSEDQLTKAEQPTVCFVARWDQRKRPELFFELARQNPDVRFIAVGGSQDAVRDAELRATYGSIPNLEMPGVINQFESDELFKIFGKSHVMVNPAAREGLPNAFLEALAYKCSVLSFSDPDGFTSKFGYLAPPEGLQEGLSYLLRDGNWKERAEKGFEHVSRVFNLDTTIAMHLNVYEQVLKNRGRAKSKPMGSQPIPEQVSPKS